MLVNGIKQGHSIKRINASARSVVCTVEAVGMVRDTVRAVRAMGYEVVGLEGAEAWGRDEWKARGVEYRRRKLGFHADGWSIK